MNRPTAMQPNALGDRAKQEPTMLKSHVTTPRIVATLAAGFILIAATEGALARVNTGLAPLAPAKPLALMPALAKASAVMAALPWAAAVAAAELPRRRGAITHPAPAARVSGRQLWRRG